MSLGCSYNTFWNEPADRIIAYAEAELFRREQANRDMWLQGLYIHNAVGAALAAAFWNGKGKRPDGYMQYPIASTPREIAAEKERKRKEALKFFMDGQKG